jgi:predicted flap endonuclease-1-like 5' DNA nuclease
LEHVARIEEIEGIGATYAEKLTAAGVSTVEALLARGAAPGGRREIAQATGVTERRVLEWVNRADLMRVRGIGSEYGDLLEAAGVDSPTELARRQPANLHARLEEINTTKKLVRRTPSLSEVERWVAESATLPKVVTH